MATNVFDVCAIVPAAGFGSRMKNKYPKQYLFIGDKTVIEHSVEVLIANPCITRIVIVINPSDTYFSTLELAKHPQITVVNGGIERANSVLAGIEAAGEAQWILVHDAVRPCLHKDDLVRILTFNKNIKKVGRILATPVFNTIKRTETKKNVIAHTVDRNDLWHALTPQFFPKKLLYKCLCRAIKEGANITDEASALEYCGFYPELIEGRSDNIKVTRQEDLQLAEFYLTRSAIHQKENSIRIGHGFDVHAFSKENTGQIVIGGVYIPYKRKLLAHSDGDVALHALIDALIGAAALGDIGKLFPNNNPVFKDISSRYLLRKTWHYIKTKGYMISNVDITIIAQVPKFLPYITQMRKAISEDLDCNINNINIKATTTEKLGFIGRGEAIACEAVALLLK